MCTARVLGVLCDVCYIVWCVKCSVCTVCGMGVVCYSACATYGVGDVIMIHTQLLPIPAGGKQSKQQGQLIFTGTGPAKPIPHLGQSGYSPSLVKG